MKEVFQGMVDILEEKNPFVGRCKCFSENNPFKPNGQNGKSKNNPFKNEIREEIKKCNSCGYPINQFL